MDPGRDFGGALLWNLSPAPVQVMANPQPFVQGHRRYLVRQPRPNGSHRRV